MSFPGSDLIVGAVFLLVVVTTVIGALIAVVSATAYGQIRLNTWNQPFYDAIERHNMGAFLHQLGVFGMIAGFRLKLLSKELRIPLLKSLLTP